VRSTLKRRLLLLALLAGCASRPPQAPQPPVAPAAVPSADAAAWYRAAAAAGRPVYAIDPAQSLVAVTVRRGGTLARLGHDHVVASRTLQGYAAPDAQRADLHFMLAEMSVDEPGLRAEAGLDTTPSADAIAGTRHNMLERVLEADRYPQVLLHAEGLDRAPGMLRLAITLHGVSRTFELPVAVERSAGAISASGTLALRQSDFGIVPLSLLGGAIAVRDELELRFRILGRRLGE
jgi:polyisoprenoid-binding protein YceI